MNGINIHFFGMSIWNSNIRDKSLPLYQAIAVTIKDGIQNGELKPGDQLPPHRDLADLISVTIGTVARGYNLAASWGLVSGEVGRGTMISFPDNGYDHVPLTLAKSYFDFGVIKPTSIEDLTLRKQAFEDTLIKIGHRWKNKSFVGFSPEFGLGRYRKAGASWISRHGLKTDENEVLLTAGGQEAFHLLLMTLTKPGDPLLVEEFTHISFKELGRALNLRMIGIPMDDQGIIPDALQTAARQSKSRVLFVTPTNNSPTTATMGLERREQIIEIARKNNIFIIENDAFSHFTVKPPPPIAALCPEQTAYVTTLTFCASPEIRVGYLKTLKKNIPRLKAAKRAFAVSHSMIAAEISTHWIESGILNDLIQWQTKEIEFRSKIALEILRDLDISYSPNGMFLWVHLPEPWRVTDFSMAATERNVIVMESDRFVIGRGLAPHAVRISLTSTQTRELYIEGLKILADLTKAPSGIDPLIPDFSNH